jgi:hypothetical protein
MSIAANIAVLILIAGTIVFLLILMVLLVLTGIALVEITALTRRFLRSQRERTGNLTQNIDNTVGQRLINPLARFERILVWSQEFFRSLRSDSDQHSRL